jgi:hypothetical protein
MSKTDSLLILIDSNLLIYSQSFTSSHIQLSLMIPFGRILDSTACCPSSGKETYNRMRYISIGIIHLYLLEALLPFARI